jgi:hypothetical protein
MVWIDFFAPSAAAVFWEQDACDLDAARVRLGIRELVARDEECVVFLDEDSGLVCERVCCVFMQQLEFWG